ncbi:transcription termination factor Rho [Liquorilactobacillus sucicola DSM 21376 = JCM 15457]|nr:transcription termination factor Rho [Liquorilactobacillus sucicola DSM 21376 = JCM 15457]
MDDVIYEEFKGTGNQEFQLTRDLAERRIFPAVDLKKSGTRKEELLLGKDCLDFMWKLRKSLSNDVLRSTEQVIKSLKETKNNREFIEEFENKLNRRGDNKKR